MVSEKKTEVLLVRGKEEPGASPPPPPIIEAAGQRYAQTTEFRCLGALLNEHGDLTPAINNNIKAAWACFRRYARELFDRRGAPSRLKARLIQAEAMEALLYGVCGMVSSQRPLPATANDTAPAALALPAEVRHLPTAILRPGPEESRLPERGGYCPAAAPALRGGRRQSAGRTASQSN